MTDSEANRTLQDLQARTTTISPKEAATLLGLHDATLANWRWQGRGPCFVRVGRRVRYRLTDLAVWMDSQTGRFSSPDQKST